MQVEALHEQITAHMHREERAAQEKASRLGRKKDRQSDWLKGCEAVSAPRDGMSADIRGDHTSKEIQESLKAETEFHIQTFKCIDKDYRTEGVCCGTWIPVWAAAFDETVHMYEVSPVQSEWDEGADRFPETVFDMLDDTRKLEQPEQESRGCLKRERGVARTTNQEWYAGKFAKKKRGDATEAEAEMDATEAEAEVDATEAEADTIFTDISSHDGCQHNPFHDSREAPTDGAEQMGQSQPDSLLPSNLPSNLVHPPNLVQLVPDRRGCVNSRQEAAYTKWKTDVNAKLREVGAGLLRVMCITDQTVTEGKDMFAAVLRNSSASRTRCFAPAGNTR